MMSQGAREGDDITRREGGGVTPLDAGKRYDVTRCMKGGMMSLDAGEGITSLCAEERE